jgi:Holliday junction resolvase-like predicted endonuclease
LIFKIILQNEKKALQRTVEHWIYKDDNEDIKEYRFDLLLIENGKVVDFIEGFSN